MGTVVQLKNRINNSYSELKNSVEEKLVLVFHQLNFLVLNMNYLFVFLNEQLFPSS